MKKLFVSMVLCLTVLSLSVSAVAGEWWSGWKYVSSIAYNYSSGKMSLATVYMSDAQGGAANQAVSISDSDVTTKKDLVKLLDILEQAKAEGLQVHVRCADGNSSIKTGESFVVDSQVPR